GIATTGTEAVNYTINTSSGTTANITAAPLTDSTGGVQKADDETSDVTVTLSDNRLSGDTLTTSYGAASFANKNVGTSKTVTVTGDRKSVAEAENYKVNTSSGTRANITAATLTVSEAGVNKVYDGSMDATGT